MGSFLNQGSHDKSSLKDGEECVVVLLAQEFIKKDGSIIKGERIPLTYIKGTSQDYGGVELDKKTLSYFMLMNERKFIDDQFSRNGISKDMNGTLYPYPIYNGEVSGAIEHGELSANVYVDLLKKNRRLVGEHYLYEKMKKGLVLKSDDENKTYQILPVVFKASLFKKAMKVKLLLEDDSEISCSKFVTSEIDKVVSNATKNHAMFSSGWFISIENELKHPLYVNEEVTYEYLHNEKDFKKLLTEHFRELLELKYLKLLGLEFSNPKYGGQDYGNEIGKEYNNLKKRGLK